MAYSPSEKYPGAVDVDPDYQGGKFRDNNPSTTNNGSPLKAIDRNELLARDEAIMNDAGFEYSGVADTPQDSQLFKAYKASLGNGANLLSNHNFLIQTPDDSQPLPSATPTSYPPGYQIFSGVFANETSGITNLTYIDGRVSFSGGDLYFSVPNTGGIERLTSNQLTASVADFDGKPRQMPNSSWSLVGDNYRVTVGIDALEDSGGNPLPLGSVKFEQGSVATGHEVQTEKGQVYSFNNVADAIENCPSIGSKLTVDDYYGGATPNNSGVLFFKVVSASTGVNDGGKYIDVPSGSRQLEQLMKVSYCITSFGAKGDAYNGDGSSVSPSATDNIEMIRNCTSSAYRNGVGSVCGPSGSFGVSDTLVIGADLDFSGVSESTRRPEWGRGFSLVWLGGVEPRKTVVQIGQSEVGSPPLNPTTALSLRNIFIDAQDKCGFCVYGTYLSNETSLKRVFTRGSTEYDQYYAKSWYAELDTLVSYGCRNNGIALGMPLIYSDGTEPDWSGTTFAYQLNQVKTTYIRAHSAGKRFLDGTDTWDLNSARGANGRIQGYGIGAGYGSGFRLNDYLSEGNGGANLYVYSDNKFDKMLSQGYVEGGGSNTHGANVIIENTQDFGGALKIENLFMHNLSGGIYTCGKNKPVLLDFVVGGNFLTSLESGGDNEDNELFPMNFCYVTNSSPSLGFYNRMRRRPVHYKEAWAGNEYYLNNTFGASADASTGVDGSFVIRVRPKGVGYSGGLVLFRNQLNIPVTSTTLRIPSGLAVDEWSTIGTTPTSIDGWYPSGTDAIPASETYDIEVTFADFVYPSVRG